MFIILFVVIDPSLTRHTYSCSTSWNSIHFLIFQNYVRYFRLISRFSFIFFFCIVARKLYLSLRDCQCYDRKKKEHSTLLGGKPNYSLFIFPIDRRRPSHLQALYKFLRQVQVQAMYNSWPLCTVLRQPHSNHTKIF